MLRFRKRTQELTLRDRLQDAARDAPQRARELKAAASQLDLPEKALELRSVAAQLDIPWARSAWARWIRENFMQLVMNPILDYYAARRATGWDKVAALTDPVIMVANHASHMDTPVILSALPRRLRKRTAVAAAADYFYRNRFVAAAVSLFFNTVPVERRGGGGVKDGSQLDSLLDDGWSILLYPEGTRSRGDGTGRLRRGAAVLASHHNVSILPIHVTGTAKAMPPGQLWPKRLRGRLGLLTHRHRIEVSFGEPIPPQEDATALLARIQSFFDATNGDGGASRSPYRRRARSADAPGRSE